MIKCDSSGFEMSGEIDDVLTELCCILDGVARGMLSDGISTQEASLYMASVFKTSVECNDNEDVADVLAVSMISNTLMWREEAQKEEESPELVISADEDEPVMKEVKVADDSLGKLIWEMLGE